MSDQDKADRRAGADTASAAPSDAGTRTHADPAGHTGTTGTRPHGMPLDPPTQPGRPGHPMPPSTRTFDVADDEGPRAEPPE